MNIALILSGGTGSRLGADIPKQYIEVGGRLVIAYCLETILSHEGIDAVQIVADEAWQEAILDSMADQSADTNEVKVADANAGTDMYHAAERQFSHKFKGFSSPGANRQLSILNGLQSISGYAADADLVLIHDAARPLLSGKLIEECLRAAEGCDGVMPALPMKDTVYQSVDGAHISALLERKQIFAGQAPEVFRFGPYYQANRALLPDRILQINGSTEPAIMAGMNIRMIPGDEQNFKITTMEDMHRFEKIVSEE